MVLDERIMALYRQGTPAATKQATGYVLGEELALFETMATTAERIDDHVLTLSEERHREAEEQLTEAARRSSS